MKGFQISRIKAKFAKSRNFTLLRYFLLPLMLSRILLYNTLDVARPKKLKVSGADSEGSQASRKENQSHQIIIARHASMSLEAH